MPIRLALEFPGQTSQAKSITFTCVSGDYDPGPELDDAYNQIRDALIAGVQGDWRIWREDV
jgi:hypothetical protein